MMNPHIASKKESSSSSSSAENFLKKGHRALNSTEIADYNAGLYIGSTTRLVESPWRNFCRTTDKSVANLCDDLALRAYPSRELRDRLTPWAQYAKYGSTQPNAK